MTASAALAPRARNELRDGWRVLCAALIGAGLSFPSVPFYSIGIFAPVLAREFAWSFASIFAGLAIASVVALIVGPFAGYLVDHGAWPLRHSWVSA